MVKYLFYVKTSYNQGASRPDGRRASRASGGAERTEYLISDVIFNTVSYTEKVQAPMEMCNNQDASCPDGCDLRTGVCLQFYTTDWICLYFFIKISVLVRSDFDIFGPKFFSAVLARNPWKRSFKILLRIRSNGRFVRSWVPRPSCAVPNQIGPYVNIGLDSQVRFWNFWDPNFFQGC